MEISIQVPNIFVKCVIISVPFREIFFYLQPNAALHRHKVKKIRNNLERKVVVRTGNCLKKISWFTQSFYQDLLWTHTLPTNRFQG